MTTSVLSRTAVNTQNNAGCRLCRGLSKSKRGNQSPRSCIFLPYYPEEKLKNLIAAVILEGRCLFSVLRWEWLYRKDASRNSIFYYCHQATIAENNSLEKRTNEHRSLEDNYDVNAFSVEEARPINVSRHITGLTRVQRKLNSCEKKVANQCR